MRSRPSRRLYHPPFERLVYIAAALRQHRAFTIRELAAHFEVDRRTILRDLVFLRDRLRYDFYYDPKTRHWAADHLPDPVL